MDKSKILLKLDDFLKAAIPLWPVKQVFLFGSWAWGHPHEESDIDVAIVVRDLDSDYLESLAKIYAIAGRVDMRIEPVLFEDGRDSSGFLAHIRSQGEKIYDVDEIVEA